MKLSEEIFFYDDITKHKNNIYSGIQQLEKQNEKLKEGINEIYGLCTHPDYRADIEAITKICKQLLEKIKR